MDRLLTSLTPHIGQLQDLAVRTSLKKRNYVCLDFTKMAGFRHPDCPRSSRKHTQTQQIEPNRSVRVLDPNRTQKVAKKRKSKLYEQPRNPLGEIWPCNLVVRNFIKVAGVRHSAIQNRLRLTACNPKSLVFDSLQPKVT